MARLLIACGWWIRDWSLSIWLLALSSTMLGCSPSVPTPHVIIEHEVFLKWDQGCAGGAVSQSLTPTKDEGVILAGQRREACATRINAQGEIVWRYDEPHDDSLGDPHWQSLFGGAVMLADDSVILCGMKHTSDGVLGLIVRIGAHGEVLSKEMLAPTGGAPMHQSRFDKCVPWEGGAALLGSIPRAPKADRWLVKVDALGRKVWEMSGQDYGGADALELADHSLVMGDANVGTTQLVRVNPDGGLQRKRIMPCTSEYPGCRFNLFHHVKPTADLRLVLIDRPHATIYHLDGALNDLEPPIKSRAALTNRAFELGDGAVYFGGESGAFIAFVAQTGQVSTIYAWRPTWDQRHLQVIEESLSISDASAISNTEFVSVRDWVAPNPGLYVDWLSIR